MSDGAGGIAEAGRRIAEEAVRRTGRLDLRNLGLRDLPEELFRLTHLRALDLGSKPPWDHGHAPNAVDARRDRLRALADLEEVGLAWSDLGSLDFAAGLGRLARLDVSRTQVADLAPLASLTALQSLDCSHTQVADLTPLAGLTALQSLGFSFTKVANLTPLASLTALQGLDCSHTQVADLTPLASLTALQSLGFSFTKVANLTPLASLTALQGLDCSLTQVADLIPLASLTALQSLDCSGTQVAELTPLAGLTALQSLRCSGTQVAELTPLAGLTTLQSLDCSHTQVADLTPLAGLTALQSLDCSLTQVTDLIPLASLTALQSLRCSFTQVADLTPPASLTALRSFDCSDTEVVDLTPLAGLTALQSLDCSGTQVADLTPLASLTGLRELHASSCHLTEIPWPWLCRGHIQKLILQATLIPDVPPELLSQHSGDSCLERLRAHLADLGAGGSAAADARLLLLGNGLAGKTQIARWLRGEPFDDSIRSTHGIQLRPFDLPGVGQVQVWDFGGQDIYHGTHALFLRNPAVIACVWARRREPEVTRDYELEGLRFRNHPLAYWAELVRHQRHPASPVLFVQSQCDTEDEEIDPFPLPPETLKALPFRRPLHVSAKADLGREEFLAALRRAVAWMRDRGGLGTARIGAGRLRVQRRLEELRQDGRCWLEKPEFDAICAAGGGDITCAGHCLEWLDASHAVFHRPGLFGDRVILDQGWALDAIYAVFDRSGCYQQILQQQGRFSRWLLGQSVWRQQGEAEQRLLLGMMRSCGICFLHRPLLSRHEESAHDEYIAPELLPERQAVEVALAHRWDAGLSEEEALFRYPLLHEGLIRSVMAEIGEIAGQDALYWRGGLLAFEAGTGSRLLIEQALGPGWGGTLRLRTQRGRAAALLQRVVELVERVQARLGLTPDGVTHRAPLPPAAAAAPLQFGWEKPAMPSWYVSYAWKDDKTPEGLRREEQVDAACAAAKARGTPIHRDKDDLRPGDSIERFMKRIASGDRVFIFLSGKYLRSIPCMFELREFWRESRQDAEVMRPRLRLWTMDDADIWSPEARAAHARHWRERHEALKPHVSDLGGRDLLLWHRMRTFYHEVGDILAALADTVQPRRFDEFLSWGFDDPQP